MRGRAAIAGGLAAAAALAAGQLPSALAGETGSLVTAVGDEVIDRFAASLKDFAVAIFGTNDKAALVVGIVVTSIAIGAALGVVAVRRFAFAAAGFAVFGAVGLASGLASQQSTPPITIVSAVVAVVAALGVLWTLLRVAAPPPHDPGHLGEAKIRVFDRRAFLAWTGGAGLATVGAGLTANAVRGRALSTEARGRVALPEPARATPVPAAGDIDVRGLSPYITPNADFYRIDTALTTPRVDVKPWRLKIRGDVDEPFELTLDELLAMDLIEEPVTIACVSNEIGGGLVGNAVWLGVPLAALLDRAGVQRSGTQIVGRSVDRFTVGFPTEVGLDGRVAMVAVGMNGEPLPFAHGFPARLVVAGLYGYVSATKWLDEIELTGLDAFDAYWIPRGWAKEAPVKTQSRIDVPRAGARLEPGAVTIAGVAWAPTRGIAGVEVQVDDTPWQAARLGTAATDNTWVQWAVPWDATPGRHELRVRATDGSGQTQTADRTSPRPDGATGWHHRTVRVAAT